MTSSAFVFTSVVCACVGARQGIMHQTSNEANKGILALRVYL